MKIVAIGGGEIGRIKTYPDGRQEQKPIETLAIDTQIIQMTGKSNPNLLFLGTASNDSPTYFEAVSNHFGGHLGCNVSSLELAQSNPTETEMRKALDGTDVIYVGGGDTSLLVGRWQESGFDKLLKEYGEKDMVLSGLSAGAVCWFDWYDNDEYIENKKGEKDWSKLDLLPGLGFIKGSCIPHFNTKNAQEKALFNNLLVKKGIYGYALDNGAAMIFDNGKISTLASLPNASIHYMNMPKPQKINIPEIDKVAKASSDQFIRKNK